MSDASTDRVEWRRDRAWFVIFINGTRTRLRYLNQRHADRCVSDTIRDLACQRADASAGV
jgi:hypothetical protein